MRLRWSAPLHPILVHFTIALTSISLVFDIAARLFRAPSLADVGWWTLAAATIITILTIGSGIASRIRLPVEESDARSWLRAHMALGPAFFGMLVAITVWRADSWNDHRPVSAWYLISLGFAAGVMTIQGFLGGELVYRYGMDVKGVYQSLPVRSDIRVPR
jgi:uncharacterized membrane protein